MNFRIEEAGDGGLPGLDGDARARDGRVGAAQV